MLSISQFLNSLAQITKVDLLCLDSKEQFQSYLENKLGLKLHPNLNIIQISNTKFGIKSNRLFFSKNVMKYINSLDKQELKIVYTRDFKQMKELLKSRSKIENTKFVFETHQILSQNLCREAKYKNAKTIRELEETVFNNVDNLICITKTLSNEIKNTFQNCTQKHIILPVGFNKDFISYKKQKKVYDIIYAGNFSKWKGVDILIEALKIVNDKKKIKAVLIGASNSDYEFYSSLVKKYQLEDSVELKKKINHKEVANYLSQSEIGVLPNKYDGDSLLFTSPLKLYEYFGIGLKVVCSRLPSIESSINSNLVYWSKAEDKDSLAEQILIALNDSDFDSNKVKEYSKNFTWEKRAEKLVQYVQSEMVDK